MTDRSNKRYVKPNQAGVWEIRMSVAQWRKLMGEVDFLSSFLGDRDMAISNTAKTWGVPEGAVRDYDAGRDDLID